MFWLGVTISLDFATNLELLFAAYVPAIFLVSIRHPRLRIGFTCDPQN